MKIFAKQLGLLVFCFTLVLGVTCYQASAHDLWLEVRDYTPEMGEDITLTLGYGHYLPAREFMTHVDLEEIYMLDNKGKRRGISRYSDVEFKGEKPLEEEGTYLVVAEKKGGFFTNTTKGYKRGQSKKGLKNVIECSYSKKYAKGIVNVGKGEGKTFSKALGHELEIIPLENPGNLTEKDYLPVKVTLKGEPVPYNHVFATYSGFSTEKNTFAYATKTNKDGIAKIKILKSGVWLVATYYKDAYPDPEECDQHNFASSLTFEVK
ncbi:MAG: DUF4198 domain-containing protein [Deltaproteobacteria bacterium]|jgi:uncharacterized GH25 family protein|nr:DUF4198 domain-containing protein [Deltaproteobacteria bacterium]